MASPAPAAAGAGASSGPGGGAPPKIVAIADVASLQAFLLADAPALHVLFFWAAWDEPSKPGGAMDTLITTLAGRFPAVKFARVRAEGTAR
jgi:hypothetical protein